MRYSITGDYCFQGRQHDFCGELSIFADRTISGKLGPNEFIEGGIVLDTQNRSVLSIKRIIPGGMKDPYFLLVREEYRKGHDGLYQGTCGKLLAVRRTPESQEVDKDVLLTLTFEYMSPARFTLTALDM